MAVGAVERLYEEARRLPPGERARLGHLLLQGTDGVGHPRSFFDTDPFLQEIKQALAGAEAQPFRSLEEAMSWSRGYDWRAEP